jgi:hypothetical protein
MDAALFLCARQPVLEPAEKRCPVLPSWRSEAPIELSRAIKRSGAGCRYFVSRQTTPVTYVDLGNPPVECCFRAPYLPIDDLRCLSRSTEGACM